MHDVRALGEKQQLFRLIPIRDCFEVPMGMNIHCHDYVISLISGSLYIKPADPILDLCNSVLVCQRPMISICREPTNRMNALMRACSLGGDDGPDTEVSSHLRFLTSR
jgi:hypothetical protein